MSMSMWHAVVLQPLHLQSPLASPLPQAGRQRLVAARPELAGGSTPAKFAAWRAFDGMMMMIAT